ncbi:hypothetical protein [Gottfriedia acidiceleris]|uniref:hypothetical protein n=1 Tax=Gottfriedia acidiceleris TaxID=371036 RepID=UPI000B42F00E|nr:hypothetical protein [Gottfriedia acidiceleris]
MFNTDNIFVLEYRLLDGELTRPIYHFPFLSKVQIFTRRYCDYFILNGFVYENRGSYIEEDRYVIEVIESDMENTPFYPLNRPLGIEIRDVDTFDEIHFYESGDELDLLSWLQSTYITINHQIYEQTSNEVDQDRNTYVMYVKPFNE